jgi:hypothetical protein
MTLPVIPGPRAARSPESITTITFMTLGRRTNRFSVFMDSGLGPSGRPGMTKGGG